MKIENESSVNTQIEHDTEVDYQPLVDLFELFFEWDMQDVQEKADEREEVS